MHEIIIQICFVVAGVVTGCTDGAVQTDNSYLSSQDISPVYVYDAPQCVSNHYRTRYTPSVTVGSLRLSWPTYTSHHSAWPSCTHAYSHYHGNHWFTWKKRYGYSHWGPKRIHKYRSHKHHAHNRHASHGHHKKSKVIVHRSGPSRVVIKPKGKYNHHKKSKGKYNHHKKSKVVVRPKVNKHKRGNVTVHRSGPSKVVIKPRKAPKRNWKRKARPKLNIPKNLYRSEPKAGNKRGKKKGKKQNRRQQRRR